MIKNTKKLTVVLAISALTLLSAACGGGTQTASGTNQSEQSSTVTDEVLKKISETKTLTIGTDATFKPFEFINGDKIEGFDIDLIDKVAKELGAEKVDIVNTDFKGLIPGLQAKKFDIIVSAIYITPERKETIDFSDPYFPAGLSITVKKDDDSIKGVEDLQGKKVAVQIGNKSVKFLGENYPEIQLVQVEKNTEMFLELESGKVDAVVVGVSGAKEYAKESGNVKVLPDLLTDELYAYGIRKENPEFTKAVNNALKKVRENGDYDKIVEKWFE